MSRFDFPVDSRFSEWALSRCGPWMLAYVDLAGFAFAVVAFLLSAVSLAAHYMKRAEHPLTAPLQSQIDSIQLTQADIIDRVEHWMKRDRVRRLRASQEGDQLATQSELPSGPLLTPGAEHSIPQASLSPQELKTHLRSIARKQGHKI